jgi:hypothetical protein
MELPDDVLKIIREYSKPVTNPNWRNRKWICVGDLYKENEYFIKLKVCYDIIYKN